MSFSAVVGETATKPMPSAATAASPKSPSRARSGLVTSRLMIRRITRTRGVEMNRRGSRQHLHEVLEIQAAQLLDFRGVLRHLVRGGIGRARHGAGGIVDLFHAADPRE